MDDITHAEIRSIIVKMVERKLRKITKETESTPFFEAFFSRSIILQASMLHSFYTSFGQSAYEQIAKVLALKAGYRAEHQHRLSGVIDTQTEGLIADLMNQPADKASEVEQIRRSIQPANPSTNKDRDRVVDVYIKLPDGSEMLFDITTVKPSKKEFDVLRLKMLRWNALKFSVEPFAQVKTYIGIPFNPYSPAPYARWTVGRLDPSEVCVQNELWAKFAGYDVFPELVEIFNEAGNMMRDKIHAHLDKL